MLLPLTIFIRSLQHRYTACILKALLIYCIMLCLSLHNHYMRLHAHGIRQPLAATIMPAHAAPSYRHPHNYCTTILFTKWLCLLNHHAATPFSHHTSFSVKQLSLDIMFYILLLLDITITISLHIYSYFCHPVLHWHLQPTTLPPLTLMFVWTHTPGTH